MTLYNPNREERAFLYQEAQDLEPLMKELGSLTVMVEEMQTEDVRKKVRGAKNRFRVTFMVAPESVDMKVQAIHTDLFSATIAAKEETLRQLNLLVNALPREAHGFGETSKPPAEQVH